MKTTMENDAPVSSHIWIIMVESGQDDAYSAGVFADEELARSTLDDLSRRLEEEDNAHIDYHVNRISARLVKHPVHKSSPQYRMVYTICMMPDVDNANGWSVFDIRRDLYTEQSLLEYAQSSGAVSRLLANPTQAFREDHSDDEVQRFVTFDPDNVVLGSYPTF